MGELAKLPERKPGIYSEADLRNIACHEYVTRNDRHFNRIARIVGKPTEIIRQWCDEDNWPLQRAEARKQARNEDATEIARLLKTAGVVDSREAAIGTLTICGKAEAMVNAYLEKSKDHPMPEYIDKILSAMERLEKLRKDAYTRL